MAEEIRRDNEQAAFEDWLESTSPSGDAESVQRQWEGSGEFRDLYSLPNDQVELPPNGGSESKKCVVGG